MAAPTRPSCSALPPEPTPLPRRHWPVFVWLLLIFLVADVAAAATGWLYYARWPGPLPQAAPIVVPRNPTAQTAALLQQDGLIGNRLAFQVAARLTVGAGPLHAGEYLFPAHATLRQVLLVLRVATPVQHHLTIPEGLTAAQIALLIDAADPLAGEDGVPPEGGFLPQTYDYLRGVHRTAMLIRGRHAMEQVLQGAWPNRDPSLTLATPMDALILASIVERETARPEERPHIAAVFLNRLRLGMKLQSDPTVAYAATGGLGALARPLERADLALDNPYNTYRYPGLPPGPICAPGLAAITAVLHPLASPDLYFVADGTGGHAFATTLEDHQRNVARWRALH